jgi:hypothetical protein
MWCVGRMITLVILGGGGSACLHRERTEAALAPVGKGMYAAKLYHEADNKFRNFKSTIY